MKFEQIVGRVTGFSCPIFGVSWAPTEADREVARRVITFLEDRRVLYRPWEMEMPEHCVKSVLEIRAYLTSELQHPSAEGELGQHLRAMRAACRKFLNSLGGDAGELVLYGSYPGHRMGWGFQSAIGELRCAFGVQTALIATRYGLDVEDDLATILPEPDEEEPATRKPRRAAPHRR